MNASTLAFAVALIAFVLFGLVVVAVAIPFANHVAAGLPR